MPFDLAGVVAGATGFQGGYEQAQARRRAMSLQEQQMRDAAARAALERQRVQQDADQAEQRSREFTATQKQRQGEFDATQAGVDRTARAGAVKTFFGEVREHPGDLPYHLKRREFYESQYPGISQYMQIPGEKTGTSGAAYRELPDGTREPMGDFDTVRPGFAPTAEQLAEKAKQESQRAGDIAALGKSEQEMRQGAVGQPSGIQNTTGKNINAARAALGLPPVPVPFDPSGQVRTVTSSALDLSDPSKIPPMDEFFAQVMGGATPPTLPTKTTEKQFPVLNPGYEPDVETQGKQAQTRSLQESAKARAMEIALMPAKLQLEYKKMLQTGQYQQAQLMLTKFNAEQGRNVTLRGQDLSAATAAENRAATNQRDSDDRQFRGESEEQKTAETKRQAAWKAIEAVTQKRDEAWNGANYYRRLLDSGVDADGKVLTPDKKKAYAALAMQNKTTGQFYQNSIDQKKKSLGVSAGNRTPQPRDKPTGRFTTRTNTGGRVINAPSGRKLTVK